MKLSRDHIRALQMSHETYARRVTTLLTSGLRQICQVNLVAIEHQSYEEYIATLAPTTILSVLDMGNMPGTALFEFSVPTAPWSHSVSFHDALVSATPGTRAATSAVTVSPAIPPAVFTVRSCLPSRLICLPFQSVRNVLFVPS